jgi:hypothetical protein
VNAFGLGMREKWVIEVAHTLGPKNTSIENAKKFSILGQLV